MVRLCTMHIGGGYRDEEDTVGLKAPAVPAVPAVPEPPAEPAAQRPAKRSRRTTANYQDNATRPQGQPTGRQLMGADANPTKRNDRLTCNRNDHISSRAGAQ